MSDSTLFWLIFLPFIAGLLAVALWLASRRKNTPPHLSFWLDAGALAAIAAGLIAEGVLLVGLPSSSSATLLGVTLSLSSFARVTLVAANVALLCAVFASWSEGEEPPPDALHPLWVVWGPVAVSGLLAGALLATDRMVSSLLLFGVALVIAGTALTGPRSLLREGASEAARAQIAWRVAGSLKHVALATVATAMLVGGAVLLGRYQLNLERRNLLELGLNTLSIGILLRAGVAPFAAPAADLVRSAPGPAIMMLGAALPGILVVGMQMLFPLESTAVSAAQVAWIGAVAALLAGIRALGTASPLAAGDSTAAQRGRFATLVAMSVAVQAGWVLFGLLSGSRAGAAGAGLLIANIALAAPLAIVSSPWGTARSAWARAGMLAAVASLLGLPPFGGFAGQLLVGQAASGASGIWLAVLLLGSALVAAAWLPAWRAAAWSDDFAGDAAAAPGAVSRPFLTLSTVRILVLVLALAQVALFLASKPLAGVLLPTSLDVPWLSMP